MNSPNPTEKAGPTPLDNTNGMPASRMPPNAGSLGYTSMRTIPRSQRPLLPVEDPALEPPMTPKQNKFTEMMKSGPIYQPAKPPGPRTPTTPDKHGVFDAVGDEKQPHPEHCLTGTEDRVVQRRMRFVYTANMRISDEDIQEYIAPGLSRRTAKFDVLRKQARDVQGRLQKSMWGSKGLIQLAFDTVNEYNKRCEADSDLVPFEELSEEDQDGIFLARFDDQIGGDLLQCVSQAIDIDGYLGLNQCRGFLAAMFALACVTIVKTSNSEVLVNGYPAVDFRQLYSTIRDAPDKAFQGRLSPRDLPSAQSIWSTTPRPRRQATLRSSTAHTILKNIRIMNAKEFFADDE